MTTSLREAWTSLPSRLKLLEPVAFTDSEWSVLERLHERFNDREAHTHLPLAIARFRDNVVKEIFERACQFDEVVTVNVDESWARKVAEGTDDPMAEYVRLYNEEVDAMMGVLVPPASYRKEHYAYGRFVFPEPHGLHTDHSLEDAAAAGEPICIARIETLGTHYVDGDYRLQDAGTRSMLNAIRYWTPAPEGEPEQVFDELLRRGTLKTIPVNHVMLMVAGNASADAQVTQHISARPPEGGMHSAFFQRQYRLTGV
ncbi:MAG: hypothetical protein EPO10_26220 [Reyranella sp.]|uniref:hypothetical protein n=1 Tax=Reyranella sp. TaxID=1929291 RepID=UPI00121CD32F|nr:hypothetical protein [Reyranella sp.]TAJ97483.1 MAG: hypothetical protein EPO41_03490 [Reyranella sp.]TBR23914.1 MAG: hypothetical protein EPO10_26220 [Reyranella sp.]